MGLARQAIEIARVDLRVERRLGDTLRVVIPFGVVALVVFPFALGASTNTLRAVGIAVFHALGVLFGMQVALRQSAADTLPRRDLYAQLGVDPAAKFLGRCLSGSILMVAYLLVLFVAMLVIYDPDLPSGWAGVGGIVLFGVGLTALGTLAGEITSGLRNRSALAPLIVAPLSAPLIIAASQLWVPVDRWGVILSWTLVLSATVLGLVVVGVGIARTLEESAR